jgi:hypothetical protein
MTRETIKQRNARVADLLSHYHEVNAQVKKLAKELEGLKDQVRAEDPGEYDGWQLQHGTPREIMDQPAVTADYEKRKVAVPTTTTKPPLIVRPVSVPASGRTRRS